MIFKLEDDIERQKRFTSGGNPAKLQGFTIYQYYWETNEMIRQAKKNQKNASTK